jgi:creatinine amidohydrolase
MREWKLAEVRYNIVRKRQYEVAVLPIGATEPHGLHMPYGTDNFEVESLADRACEQAHAMGAKVILLPTIPFGVNTNQMAFPLAINVNPSTQSALITDIVRSLETNGIPKMILLNGHGGNNFNPLLRELYGKTRVFLTWVDSWNIAKSALAEIFEHPGEHADEMETSWILHLRPDLVFMEECDDGAVKAPRLTAMREGWAWFPRPWERLTQNSGFGDPRQATAEKGERFLAASAERLAQFIKELSDATIDATFPY